MREFRPLRQSFVLIRPQFLLQILLLVGFVTTPRFTLGAAFGASPTMQKSVPKNFFFTENKGQWDDRVLYKCEAKNGLTWFLERDGITLLTMKEDRSQPPIVDEFERDLPEMMRKHPARYPMKGHALKFKFLAVDNSAKPSPVVGTGNFSTSTKSSCNVGTGTPACTNSNQKERQAGVPVATKSTTALAQSVEATGELSWHNNYFLGNDSSKWAPDCRNFTSVIYREVWSGIDIEWYESDGQLEFDFVVHPGFDPNQIRMSCEGLEGELSFADNDPIRGNDASRAASRTTVGNFADRRPNHFDDHFAITNSSNPNTHGRGVSNTPSGNSLSLNENDKTGECDSPLRNNQTNPRLNVGTGTPACTNSDQNERQAGVPVATKSSTGGMLRLLTSIGELRTALPSVYQISANGSRCELSAQFQLTSPNTFGISLPEHYDPNQTLRVDPLVFSKYLSMRPNIRA